MAKAARAHCLPGKPSTPGLLSTIWQLSDVQFSVIAVLNNAGQLSERVEYSPYGVARHYAISDFNGSGDSTTQDIFDFLNAWFAGAATADFNRSGLGPTQQDIFDFINTWFAVGSIPAGEVSSRAIADNPVGYCGYLFNKETQDYCVRFRHYAPGLGRWLERDPAGYVDGMGLYQYVASNPCTMIDATGLDAGWASRPGNDPYGEYLGCGISINLRFWVYNGWTEVDRSRIRLAAERAKHRAMSLIDEIKDIRSGLSQCVLLMLNEDINELEKRLRDLVALLNGEEIWKDIRLHQASMGENEAVTDITWGMPYTCLNSGNSSDPRQFDWKKLTLDQLSALLMHEFSHIVEGPIDYDGSTRMCDLHHYNQGGGYYYLGCSRHTAFKHKIMKAKESCGECRDDKSSK